MALVHRMTGVNTCSAFCAIEHFLCVRTVGIGASQRSRGSRVIHTFTLYRSASHSGVLAK